MTDVIIIDDESPAREIIREYLSGEDDMDILAEYDNGFDAVKGIRELKPEIIFLDIQMPRLDGFEVLELLDDPPVVIFTTAYDQYALRAFEMSAVDYLLKPFSGERFAEALHKARSRLNTRQKSNMDSLVEARQQLQERVNRLVVRDRDKIHVIPVEQVLFIEGEDDYAGIHTEAKKYLKQQRLKSLEKLLDPRSFVRIHRSYVVNIQYIKELQRYEKDRYRVILKNGTMLPVSKSGYPRLKSVLGI